MANALRSTVTIDGNKFDALSTVVGFSTQKDRSGMPEMGSLATDIKVYIDFHDDNNVPQSTLKRLFELAHVVTRDKVVDMKIEYWKDEAKKDALCSYRFKGWISRFETSNPLTGQNGNAPPVAPTNHLLTLELEPSMNQQNFKDISMGN
jgi:hypothetical protein